MVSLRNDKPRERQNRSQPVGTHAVTVVALALAAFVPAVAAQGAMPAIVPQTVVGGLEHPWALAFLPDGSMLVTERPGRLRRIVGGRAGEPVSGLPAVDARGQGGLLDLIADRDFASNRTIYFCYAEPQQPGRAGPNGTAMARARLADDARHLENVSIIFRQAQKADSRHHFGCRIAEADDGTLFLGLGDRYAHAAQAQTLDNHHGKVVRVHKDGRVPAGNPHGAGAAAAKAGALPEIWSHGHRNIQGATLHPQTRALWTVEHGPQGGDELNIPQAGRNYGWPVITHGENYGGGAIGEGSAKPGMEPPLHHWTPSIAPSGMAFLTSERYGKAMQGSLFVGSLKYRRLHRLVLDGGKVVREERLLQDLGERIRDVRQGPDGWLYVITDARDGRVLRLAVADERGRG